MKKYLSKTLAVIIPSILFLPSLIYAQQSGLVPCSGADCNFNSIISLVNNIIKYFLTIAVSVAAITFAFAGGKILLGQGNPGKISDGKKMIWNTIWGMIIVLCSWLVIYTILKWVVPSGSTALRFLGQ